MTEQKLTEKLVSLLISLESIQDDANRASELAGEYVKDAIAKIEIALRHPDD